jgi:rhamnose transport system ATP-binding protein
MVVPNSFIRGQQLSKSYVGVCALHNVDLEIAAGEVHAICGENGAGKSTLIKLLSGVIKPDHGELFIDGEPFGLGSVVASEAAGIAVMHQESTVFPDLDVIDNVFVGRERTFARGWFLDRTAMLRETKEILARLGETFDVTNPVKHLSVAHRQIVAMARALIRNCRLLIMDEPTASLSARETATLLNIIRQLRDDGVSVLYISHRLDEVFQIANRVTVLRDGQAIATRQISTVTKHDLIRWMVGREVDELSMRHPRSADNRPPMLEVRHLTRAGAFEDVSLTVRPGEIVGLAGLVGAGRSEVAKALFGIDRYDSGQVVIDGRALRRTSIRDSLAAGLALVPEDRQHEGLVLPMSVGANLSLAMLSQLTRCGVVRRQQEKTLIEQQIRDLDIRTSGSHAAVATLSGGNQQKVVLGKWLATKPKVLILDEPTRGIDVGAKAQVHRLIRSLAETDVAILVISSELPELLAISDRLLVMRQGKIAGELSGVSATQEQVLRLALPDSAEVLVA